MRCSGRVVAEENRAIVSRSVSRAAIRSRRIRAKSAAVAIGAECIKVEFS
jgi:hypothetical protein